MNVQLINNNIFTGNEQALILTVDGAATGMEGNIARAFSRHYPECWEELSLDIDYPIPLGQSRLKYASLKNLSSAVTDEQRQRVPTFNGIIARPGR